MKPNVYITGHLIADKIGHAFGRGIGVEPIKKFRAGPGAGYGILRGNGERFGQTRIMGHDYYYMDHGYFRRGHFNGYYRITKNALQARPLGDSEGARFQGLSLGVKPWRKTGAHIVLVPPTDVMGAFRGVSDWLAKLPLVTDREVYVSTKSQNNFHKLLENAWCIVTDHSNCAVDALLEGVPVVTTGWETPFWAFENIESPVFEDREPWFNWLADNQFTLAEMESGEAWSRLESTSDGIKETFKPLRFVKKA